VGDTRFSEGFRTLRVIDTAKPTPSCTPKWPQDLTGLGFVSRPDAARRTQIRQNHSATHSAAGRPARVLGSHVQQKGLLVNEKLLRFDFSRTSN
jgi:alanyl-tRNA synthetase